MITSNPKQPIENFTLLEQKVEDNTATLEEYKALDAFLTTKGLSNFIISRFRKKGINSFEEFLSERNRKKEYRNVVVDTELVPVVLGAIDAVRFFMLKA